MKPNHASLQSTSPLAGLSSVLASVVIGIWTLAPVARAGVTFTTNTVIDTSNQAYEGQDIVVQGCTVTVNGAHGFNSVSLLSGAVLTHQATTPSQEYSLTLTLANNLTVDGTSKIDVSGRGYQPGYTLGNTNVGAAVFTAGGSYGGYGMVCCGEGSAANAVYGDYHNPNELGSGSGTYGSGGAPGGGLVRITAGGAQVDGGILANGGNGQNQGGSGGGIWLSAGTLSGSGQITANGGNGGGYDGGGGGRVAIYYGSSTFNLTSNVTADAGNGPQGPGSVGTVYLKPTGGLGQLVISSHGTPTTLWTPLGAQTDAVFQVDMLLVSGTNVVAAPAHQMAMDVGAVSIVDAAVLTHQPTTASQEYSLLLTVTNNLVVDGASSIDVSGRGYQPGYTLGNTNLGGAIFTAGGSYGGYGMVCCGGGSAANAVYGDYHNPNDLGSGSGTYGSGGAPGGGLVRITAGRAQVDGGILANGGNGQNQGGSGGGIWLNAGTLSGSGQITANGGNGGGYDGGGGGRVAIYYGSSTFNLTSNVTANAGGGPEGPGSVGTVYLQPAGGPGQLVISSHGTKAGLWTAVGAGTDAVFQVDMLLVSGTNVVAAPEHQMAMDAGTVSIVDGAMLTHQLTTAVQEYSLLLTVTNNLVVDGASSIDASGRGYLPGYTLGNTTTGAASFTAGGSYGGLGELCCGGGANNAVYGQFQNPNELGSGSGTYGGGGAAGGGLVRISAGTAQVDGAILADGGSGSDQGGSGGGIWLSVGTLSGSGQIAANGGNGGAYDGGGGGRVAIYYASSTFNLSSNVTANAGTGPDGPGSVGTVYLKPAGGLGQLALNSHGTPAGQWTPLGVGTDAVFQVDMLLVSGTNVVAAPEHQMAMEVGTVSILDWAVLTHQPTTPVQEYSLLLTVASNLLVDGASRIDISGRGYLPGYTLGNTTTGAAYYTAGGSYGGSGGLCCGSTDNAVYGDYHNPNELGSGSGTYGNAGASGGGLARITAGEAQVDGAILANGGNGPDQGGSGGGIWLSVGTLSGVGEIAANGGNGAGYDGGGGGRVAIYYGSSSFGLSSNVTAKAGNGNSAAGSVGTVYLKQTGSLGLLVISSHGTTPGQWTPLGHTNDLVFTAEALVISGTGTVAATVSGAPIQAASLSLVDGAVLTHPETTADQEYSLVLTVTNELLVDAASRIDVSARGYLPGYTLGNTTIGAAFYTAGGAYGGSGGLCCGSTGNAVYGDYHNPNELGSGSGTYGNGGAPGGGLVRITAATAQVDGAILANGGNGSDQGGSGGGVLVNAGTLSGSGQIAANGGASSGYDGGGGGRVAIYYNSNTFNLSSNVTATAGNGSHDPGSVGTVYLQPAGGLGQLVLSSHGTAAGQWTPLGVGTDAVFQVDMLLVSGSNVVAAPEHQMAVDAVTLSIIDGAALTHQVTTPAQEYSLLLTVTSNLLVDGASRIDVSGRGYLPGYTLGNTTTGAASYTAGGSYGGLGGLCCNGGADNALYGLYENPSELGSGSGTYGNGGGPGGGLVRITAGAAQVDGAILANGGNGSDQGGSGGGVLVNAGALSGSGQITANGGAGGSYDGGGGGRVAIYTWTPTGLLLAATNVLASGGYGTDANGGTGTVYFASQPFVMFSEVPQYWHGVQQISWQAIGIDPKGSDTANLVVSANGVTYFKQSVPTTGSTSWDTTTVSNGNYTLTMNFFNPSGAAIGLLSQNILINNSVTWHEGTLTTSQTWASGTVHVVDVSIVIPSGVTLTIAPGAIVKFTKGTGISVQPGGILDALGTSTQPIIFTSFADGSAGGDSTLAGGRSQPEAGDWSGVAVLGGQFNYNAFVDIRYSESTVAGTLATSQSWLGNAVYLVSNSVVVPTGVTLTINPGAVVKFVAGAGLTVQAGGTLNALGTVAQPITFTSINDDSVGGVSNNGSSTAPAAGDWVGLNISGQAFLNHCDLSYGGNTGAGAFASGVIIVNSGSLALSNSVVSTALYDGLSIYGSSGTGVVVNTVLRYLDRAVWAWGGGSVRLVNCTFDQDVVGLDNHGGGTIDAENCIIANYIQASSNEGAVTVRYSDVWSSYANTANPVTIGQNGNISTNPMFINEPRGDYRLNYSSPCINAADGTLAPASDLQGYPPYNDPLIPTKTGVANAAGIYPDMGAFAFVEGAPSGIDLVAENVGGPATVTAGQVVTVQWTDANNGTGTAAGPWHDTVSLISSTNTNTVLTLGVSLEGQGAVLGPGGTYSASASFAVPGGTEGSYFWQVHVNSSGDVYEGANWTNNITLSSKPTTLSVPPLAVGGSATNIILTPSSPNQWFKFVAATNGDVVVSLNLGLPGSGVQLFAGAGYMPTPQQYDFTQNQFDFSAPTMTIPAVAGQTYYILVYGQSLPPGVSAFALQAQVPNFGVSSVNPTSVGNVGAVTFEVLGAQLAAGTAVAIVSPKGIVQPALTNYLANSALAYATFDMSNAAAGLWSLQVTSGGAALTLSNAFEVVAGGGPDLTAQVVGNNFIRVGLPYQYTLTYNNAGDDDAYYGVIVITGVPTNATVTLGPEFVSPAQPQGVTNPPPPYAGTGAGLTLTPLVIDRLRPGEGGSATFTVQVPAGTPGFSITPEVLGPAAEPLPNAFFTNKTSVPRSKLSLPCFPADQDLAGADFLLGLAIQYGVTGNFALGGWANSGNACVGEAAFMKGIYDNESLLTSSPISGWTFTIVTKNGFGIGHTTVLATAPSGNSYIIDNYVSPTIIPMVGVKGQWNISPDCYIFGSPTGNAFIALDLLIETAGGGFFWTEPPSENPQQTCPLPKFKTPLLVTPKSSYDPNLKVGPESGTPQGYVSAQQPLTYEIGFANEASASAPAQEVTVTDTLSPNLDWSTLQLQTIGFNGVTLTVPSGAQAFTTQTNVSTDPNPVLVTASFDPSTGLLSWDIKTIDPATGGVVEDVLAGFLPPDNAQGAGEGFVTYTVKPKPGLPTGSVIHNQATIVFDVNPPIQTGTVTNTIDATAPTSVMSPLPATSPPTFTVSWSGKALSGVASFNLYSSTNGGPWGPWLLGATNSSATFTGVSGNSYAFYSVAISQVGLAEVSPVIPGAQTTVGVVQQGPLLSHFAVTNGQFQFTLNLTSTNSFVIQASTDLKTWISLQTNQAPFTYVDTNSARSGRRFYRTQTLP